MESLSPVLLRVLEQIKNISGLFCGFSDKGRGEERGIGTQVPSTKPPAPARQAVT
jgi:hypothetical protein